MSDAHLLIDPDRREAALEANCATLIALELLCAVAGDNADGTRPLEHQIILVKRRITELRGAAPEPYGALAYGFVLDALASEGPPAMAEISCGRGDEDVVQ